MNVRRPTLTTRALRAFLYSARDWSYTARLAGLFVEAGCQVIIAAPTIHPSLNKFTTNINAIGWRRQPKAISRLISSLPEDSIICPCDDTAILVLHHVHRLALPTDEKSARMIEKSMGCPESFETSFDKALFTQFAQQLGIRTPQTVFNFSPFNDRRELPLSPLVLKRSTGDGGAMVLLARNNRTLGSAWGIMCLKWFRQTAVSLMSGDYALAPRETLPQFMVQEYIRGNPANRAVACYKGEVIAGLSVTAHETHGLTGRAKIVEIIDNPEMEAVVRRLVKKMKLSGFVGVDFVIERDTGNAYALEMNARTTPTVNLGVRGEPTLAASLASAFTGAQPKMTANKLKIGDRVRLGVIPPGSGDDAPYDVAVT